MSRIGKKPIAIPKGVTVKVTADAIEVQGPKGKLRQLFPPGMAFESRTAGSSPADPRRHRAVEVPRPGRSLVANAVAGVTEGFKRDSTSWASATAPS